MPEPLILRDADAAGIVVVRFGEVTLLDPSLADAAAKCHERWGIWGFSVFEVPGEDYGELVRLRPAIAVRRLLLEARAHDLIAAGFALLPTLGHPHWTVRVSEPTSEQFARVRTCFTGPLDNPTFAGRRRR